MNRRMLKYFLVLGLLAVAACPTFADTIVSVGAVNPVSVGDSFTVDVNIANVIDLYDFQLDLAFDPALVQLNNVAEGSFLSSGGSTFFLPGFIDNALGNATFNADTLLGATPGVNGSGPLLRFDFTALSVGTSALTLSNIILQDSVGNLIDFTSADGSVLVTTPVTTPASEPATLLLLAAAGVPLLLSFRRK